MAKKIMALVMAIALVVCFAVSASAEVITTTKYVVGETPEAAEAEVSVTVTDVNAGDNVTYYAKNANGDVYVNQEKATSTSVTFNYITAHANIVDSNVIIGYTNVEDAYEGEIPDAPKYTISCNDVEVGSVYQGVEDTSVTFDYSAPDYETVTNVAAEGAIAVEGAWSFDEDANKLTVVLSDINDNVVISVTTEDITIDGYEANIDFADAAAIVVKEGAENAKVFDNEHEQITDEKIVASVNADKAGDRKLTVCGKIEGTYPEYGIIVSETEIASENLRPEDFATKYADKKYAAATKGADNRFAVQLIDTSTATEGTPFVVKGTPYYTAIYVLSADETAYTVVAGLEAVTAN